MWLQNIPLYGCIITDVTIPVALFKMQDRFSNFNVTKLHFIVTASESTLLLAFKTLPLVKFWCVIKEEYL